MMHAISLVYNSYCKMNNYCASNNAIPHFNVLVNRHYDVHANVIIAASLCSLEPIRLCVLITRGVNNLQAT